MDEKHCLLKHATFIKWEWENVHFFYAEAEKMCFQAYETSTLHWGRSSEELKSQTLINQGKQNKTWTKKIK